MELDVVPIGLDCVVGQDVWFIYMHQLNHKSEIQRCLKSKFLRYTTNEQLVIIQRKDCMNPSRVSISKVYKEKEVD